MKKSELTKLIKEVLMKETLYNQKEKLNEDISYATAFGGIGDELDLTEIQKSLSKIPGFETPNAGIWNKISVMYNGTHIGWIQKKQPAIQLYTANGSKTYKWSGIDNYVNLVKSSTFKKR